MKVTIREKLGHKGNPYLIRWVLDFSWFSIRIHHWLASDDMRHLHDHPWSFWTFVLRGGYFDFGEDRIDIVLAGSWRFREAEYRHSVYVPHVYRKHGTWTFLVCGPEKRTWGFWVKGKFRKRNKYFRMFGHH